MKKNRVILADTDPDYLEPLVLKFLEEYGNDVDLEVITDRQYFDVFFSAPQKANTLLVSELMYSQALQRHEIQHIFVLTEGMDADGAFPLAESCLYKYTSIKEILGAVASGGSGFTESPGRGKKESEIITFFSPVGGSGTTSLALGTAMRMANAHKRVLYINAEPLNVFQYWLADKTPISNRKVVEFSAHEKSLFSFLQSEIRNETIDYLPPFGAALPQLNLQTSIYCSILAGAKESHRYDAIIVDAGSAYTADTPQLMALSNKVVLVTTQTKRAAYAMNTFLKNANCSDSEKYFFVCNRYSPTEENYLLMADSLSLFLVSDYVDLVPDFRADGLRALSDTLDLRSVVILLS